MSNQLTAGNLIFGLIIQVDCQRLFDGNFLLLLRELQSGLPVIPYCLGRILGNFIEFVFYSWAFLCGYYPFLDAHKPFIAFWIMFLLLHLAISGYVNLLMVIFRGSNRSFLTIGIFVIFWAMAGFSPPPEEIKTSLGIFGMIVYYISPFHYSTANEVIMEMNAYPEIWQTDKVLESIDLKSSYFNKYFTALIGMFIIANMLTLLAVMSRIKKWTSAAKTYFKILRSSITNKKRSKVDPEKMYGASIYV